MRSWGWLVVYAIFDHIWTVSDNFWPFFKVFDRFRLFLSGFCRFWPSKLAFLLANSSSTNLSKMLGSSVDVEATQNAPTIGSAITPSVHPATQSNSQHALLPPPPPIGAVPLKPTIKSEKMNLETLVKMKNANNLSSGLNAGLTQQTRQRFSSVDSLRSNEYSVFRKLKKQKHK